jgi:hypothetical protein
MLKLQTIFLSIAALAYAIPQATTLDVTQSAPGPINITEVQTSGPGCGRGKARLENGTILLGPLTEFEASWQDQANRQIYCLVMAQVTYPLGKQFSVLPGIVNGTASLEPGVTARFLYSHHYQQSPQVSVSRQRLVSDVVPCLLIKS